MSRTRARCWCGRKFDPTRSLDGVSCHEHDADLAEVTLAPSDPTTPGGVYGDRPLPEEESS